MISEQIIIKLVYYIRTLITHVVNVYSMGGRL